MWIKDTKDSDTHTHRHRHRQITFIRYKESSRYNHHLIQPWIFFSSQRWFKMVIRIRFVVVMQYLAETKSLLSLKKIWKKNEKDEMKANFHTLFPSVRKRRKNLKFVSTFIKKNNQLVWGTAVFLRHYNDRILGRNPSTVKRMSIFAFEMHSKEEA